jgi:hypothetical protein
LRDQFEDAAQDCRALIAVTRRRFIVGPAIAGEEWIAVAGHALASV